MTLARKGISLCFLILKFTRPWYQGHPRCSGHEPLEFSGSVGSCMKRYYPGPNVYIYAKLEESATPGFLDLSYPCNEECKSCPMGVAIPISLDGDCGRMNTTIHYPIEEFFVVDARLSKDPFFKIFYL